VPFAVTANGFAAVGALVGTAKGFVADLLAVATNGFAVAALRAAAASDQIGWLTLRPRVPASVTNARPVPEGAVVVAARLRLAAARSASARRLSPGAGPAVPTSADGLSFAAVEMSGPEHPAAPHAAMRIVTGRQCRRKRRSMTRSPQVRSPAFPATPIDPETREAPDVAPAPVGSTGRRSPDQPVRPGVTDRRVAPFGT
jgi:hypothetical protein